MIKSSNQVVEFRQQFVSEQINSEGTNQGDELKLRELRQL